MRAAKSDKNYDAEPRYIHLDLVDVPIKDDLRSMSEPLYSLTKKPNTRPLTFHTPTEKVTINPGVHGLPTIYDKDIVIYCMSQLAALKRRGGHASADVKFTLHEIMVATNRDASARGYNALKMALKRLNGTRFVVESKEDSHPRIYAFNILEWFRIVEASNGRMVWVEATLSKFVVEAAEQSRILTLHRDYFRIPSPIARRIYEIARRHCGDNHQWTFRLITLKELVATKQPLRNFRLLIGRMAKENNLPDYTLTFKDDKLTFHKRNTGGHVAPRTCTGPATAQVRDINPTSW